MNNLALLTGADTKASKIYSDDVFSSFVYTGNGSTQTINNGLDLAGKGGLVWLKNRSRALDNIVIDTVRGASNYICSNKTDANIVQSNSLTAFNSNGFSVDGFAPSNFNDDNQIAWAFRRAPKFFDVVAYTGNTSGGSSQTISHSLGQEPGLIIIKATSIAGENWVVWHRLFSVDQAIYLNLTNAVVTNGAGNTFPTLPTSTHFTVGFNGNQNGNGTSYVAYLFAHDTSVDGLVQCGSFTTDGSGNATVNLGWEPQYLMVKNITSVNNWSIFDTMRGFTATSLGNPNVNSNDAFLYANSSASENSNYNPVEPRSTGFGFAGGNIDGSSNNATFIYLAIRRPNKPPTLGTQVYNAIARTGTGAAATVTGVGFAPDLAIIKARSTANDSNVFYDRLRGRTLQLYTNLTSLEADKSALGTYCSFDNMSGVVLGPDNSNWYTNSGGIAYINHFFKRAPGVFDICCYTGTGVAKTESHSLGVVPELTLIKRRSAVSDWLCGISYWITNGDGLQMTSEPAISGGGGVTSVTSTSFSVQTNSTDSLNASVTSATYVAYLFASKPNVSKITSYTGNGSSQTIECGFTTGARFVMIKATSTTGDWLVGDSTRGLVSGNDPRLSLNSTAAEVTTEDWLDPHTSGFIVNEVTGSNANTLGVSYIVLAFA